MASAVLGVFLYAWARPVVPGDQGPVRQVAALFTGNPVSDGGDFSESDISKQHRFVEVKPATMEALANGADRVRLQLLDGREYTVLLTAREDGPVASVAQALELLQELLMALCFYPVWEVLLEQQLEHYPALLELRL